MSMGIFFINFFSGTAEMLLIYSEIRDFLEFVPPTDIFTILLHTFSLITT